jgi:transposase-like protein
MRSDGGARRHGRTYHRFAAGPTLRSRLREKWKNYARPVGSSWRVDETYIKVKSQWRYLYRAVGKQGQTVDFLLSKNRDKTAAVRFFKKAIGNNEVPEKLTLDGSRASHQAVAELKAEGALSAQTLVRAS